MRMVLRLFGTRYTVAVLLVLLVGAIIGLGRLVGGAPRPTPIGVGAQTTPATTQSPEDDDGVVSPASPPAPSTSHGALAPLVVADKFIAAWLHHTGVTPEAWYGGMRAYLTSNLAGELNGVDPAGVPASRTTGPATLVDHDAAYVEVTIPVDSGTVNLRLLATGGRWFVDGVDWTRG